MDKTVFLLRREELIELIARSLSNTKLTAHQEQSLQMLLEIIKKCSFENRLQMKGVLSYALVDSLDVDYAIGKKFMQFDEDIK